MSQFGMQMQGSRQRRPEWSTVYNAMLLISCVALAVACAFMWTAASSVSPEGSPWKVQEANRIVLQGGR